MVDDGALGEGAFRTLRACLKVRKKRNITQKA